MNFVAREMELNLLDDLHRRPSAQFLIVYGRRRIGKTRLLNEWAERLSGRYLYWGATQTSRVNQLRRFSQALWQFMNPDAAIDPAFSYASWDAAFAEVKRLAQEERLVLILDEFTYVMQADPEVLRTRWLKYMCNDECMPFGLSSSTQAGCLSYGIAHILTLGCTSDIKPFSY
ncbi:MAG: ATP-binding protein [Chloroflexota bacterium]